ncbi:MAG: hypothetical protein DRI30_01395 [Chloroflexi bacterium]|nr:MAG: hypothetical protein DRI30_01395 [Chloroflexota bacterium]
MEQRIQYTTTADGLRIAYSVTGSGPAFIWDAGYPFNHLKAAMDVEPYRAYFERLAADCTLIRLDHRAAGLSQRDKLPESFDDLTADLEAVVSAVNLGPLSLGGSGMGGGTVANYTSRHPGEVSRLVLMDTMARGAWNHGAGAARWQTLQDLARSDWEMFSETTASVFFGWGEGGVARDAARFIRECTSPEAVSTIAEIATDFSDLYRHMEIPALVLRHEESVFPPMEAAIELTALIPGAELVLLDGTWLTTSDRAIRAAEIILDFIGATDGPKTGATLEAAAFRTVLFTDIVGHTEMMSRLGDARGRDVLREHERITREALAAHGGTEVKTMGDGFMASFASVTKSVECAVDLQKAFAARNASAAEPLHVRVGLNAGEPIEDDGDLFGATVILASRIAAKADGGEILVSNVVRELVTGKDFLFNDRGDTELRGFEDPVRVYEVWWRDG